jgi:hypothetical protein
VPASEQHPSTALDASELPESVSPERGVEVPHARTAAKRDVATASVVLANTASCAFVFMIQNFPCADIDNLPLRRNRARLVPGHSPLYQGVQRAKVSQIGRFPSRADRIVHVPSGDVSSDCRHVRPNEWRYDRHTTRPGQFFPRASAHCQRDEMPRRPARTPERVLWADASPR